MITGVFVSVTERWELGEFETSTTRDRVVSKLAERGVQALVPGSDPERAHLTVALWVSETMPTDVRTTSVATYEGESVVLSVSGFPIESALSCGERASGEDAGTDGSRDIVVRGFQGCGLDRAVGVSRVIWDEGGIRFSAESSTMQAVEMSEWLEAWELLP